MSSLHRKAVLLLLMTTTTIAGFSQSTRAFNQNASRSNHSRINLTISPVFSSPVKGGSDDTLLFRSSGAGLQMGLDYKIGKAGIGFITGFTSTGNNTAAVNQFMKKSGLGSGQTTISKSRQQQTYLLLGPSASIGKEIQLEGHFKAGLFLNNAGNTGIHRGLQETLYRTESTDKNAAFGFITGIKLRYNLGASPWSLAVGADYLQTRTQVNSYDIRYGQQSVVLQQQIKDLLGHISISYTLPARRPTVSNITRNGFHSVAATAGCGIVVQRTTLADGTVKEMYFACPEDAAAYNALAKTPDDQPQLRAQNNNTVRSNRTDNAYKLNNDSSVGNPEKAEAQDFNTTRSNRERGQLATSPGNGGTQANNTNQLKAQNNNTVRSNRSEFKSILIEADTDNDGDYETDMSHILYDEFFEEREASANVQDHNSSRSNKSAGVADHNSSRSNKSSSATDVQDHNSSRSNKSLQPINETEGKTTTDAHLLKAGVSTSRSNIRTRLSLQAIKDDLYISYGTAIVNNKEVNIKVYYKGKHETAKNSVGNIR